MLGIFTISILIVGPSKGLRRDHHQKRPLEQVSLSFVPKLTTSAVQHEPCAHVYQLAIGRIRSSVLHGQLKAKRLRVEGKSCVGLGILLEGMLIPVLQYSWWRTETDECIDAWWHGGCRPQTNKNHARAARAEQPKLLLMGKKHVLLLTVLW